MNCPNCARENPANAKFCIYCATSLAPEPTVAEPAPAIGPTVRLNPEPAPAYSLPTTPAPASATPQPAPAAPSSSGSWATRFNDGTTGAVFMIGLGFLFLTGSFFPGILVLLGITGYMSEIRRGRQQAAMQALVFFAGLALLFAVGNFFPGILFLLGALYFLGRRSGGRGWC